MPRVTQLGHVGIYVQDLPKMRDFYTRVMGLTVTDEDTERGLTFFSSRPDAEHHEFVIMPGRTAPSDTKIVQQISWHVESVDELLAFHRVLRDEGVSVQREITHGIALAIYFLDPEGNTIEVYWATDKRIPQPFGRAVDMDQSAEDVLAQAAKLIEGIPERV
jgi:catechol-2,3-dioxygenase